MKIDLYLSNFPASGQGLNDGAVKYVHGFASGLTACGAEVTVLCEGVGESSLRSPSGYGIRSFPRFKFGLSRQICPGLAAYVKQQQKESLFVLNGMFSPKVYLLSRLLKNERIPYIVSPLDPYHPSIFDSKFYLKWPYWYLFERPMLRRADAIQVLDARHTEWLRSRGIRSKTIATPCGFSVDEVKRPPAPQNSQSDVIKLFFLGRMDSHNKGLDILIDAFATLPKERSYHLYMQGPDKGDKAMLKSKVADMGIAAKVTFLEPDYTASPQSLISKYDIVCVPSRFEGFSQVILEAMLAARTVLVSEVAGIAPHVLASDCGVVVRPKISAIAEGILRLSERRSEWGDMGLRGRWYVIKNFDWTHIAGRAIEQYKLLLDGRRRESP